MRNNFENMVVYSSSSSSSNAENSTMMPPAPGGGGALGAALAGALGGGTRKERRLTETMSETSEATSTTTTATSVSGQLSFDNAEELRELAAALQVEDPELLQQERIRVDRRKLEQMLLGDYLGDSADEFFNKVMKETNTLITWPARLKIGAKSKKDPHVKVVGLAESITRAKERIGQVLDTRNTRVTMKLDVSYTDHSHIIGKGGLTIKKVMEETNCHIHFPDSNRSNHQEKSNQVSIAGDMEGVERARARVRELTPLIFSFELPVTSTNNNNNNNSNNHNNSSSSNSFGQGGGYEANATNGNGFSGSPYVLKIQESYNVQVMFRTRPKLHATLVLVKGCEWEPAKTKEATVLLIHHMCGSLSSQIQISPQHHAVVLGKQNMNLKGIIQRTSTRIMFPDGSDPNLPSLKKNNVTILGSIHNVYAARQQLMGSLPLVLMFDVPEKSSSTSSSSSQQITTDYLSRLMQSLEVFVSVRLKPKQSTLSVVVKGIERNASNVYEARRQLLNLAEDAVPRVVAMIPRSYLVPPTTTTTAATGFQRESRTSSPAFSTISSNSSAGSLSSGFHSLASSGGHSVPQLQPEPLFSPVTASLHQHHQQQQPSPYALGSLLQQQQQQQALQNALSCVDPNSPIYQRLVAAAFNANLVGGLFADAAALSSSVSSSLSSLSSPGVSPRTVSPVDLCSRPAEVNPPNYDLSSVFGELALASDSQQPDELGSVAALVDLEKKKLMAIRAMQAKPNASDYRVPTSVWSGYGFSQSIPHISSTTAPGSGEDSLNSSSPWSKDGGAGAPTSTSSTHDFAGPSVNEDAAAATTALHGMGASNYLDNTSNLQLGKITSQRHTDLASMLTRVGLDKYIHLFTSHEVDMATFPTLSEKDLSEIGVTAWGARRKIMLLIAEMNKRNSSFSGSAAPGAERKLASLSSSVSSMSPPSSNRNSSLDSNSW